MNEVELTTDFLSIADIRKVFHVFKLGYKQGSKGRIVCNNMCFQLENAGKGYVKTSIIAFDEKPKSKVLWEGHLDKSKKVEPQRIAETKGKSKNSGEEDIFEDIR